MRPSPLRKSRGSDRSRSPSQVRAAATRKPLFVHWVEPFCTASGIQRDAFQVRLSRPLALCKQNGSQVFQYVFSHSRRYHILFAAAMEWTEVLATACSGTGAPSHALTQLVGAQNVVEVVSSESHALLAAFCESSL